MPKRINFNNARAGNIDPSVVHTIHQYLQDELDYGSQAAEQRVQTQLDAFYTNAAKLINAKATQIAFMQNASCGFTYALRSIPLTANSTVAIANSEYINNVVQLRHWQQQLGFTIVNIPEEIDGRIASDGLEKLLQTNNVQLICVTHCPNNNGLINPVVEIGKLAHEHGAAYIIDAAQSLGQIPIDVTTLNCDFLWTTGKKYLRGPRGSGFLYCQDQKPFQNQTFLDFPILEDLNAQSYPYVAHARRYEWSERNVAIQLGFGQAIKNYLTTQPQQAWQTTQHLATMLRRRLQQSNRFEIFDYTPEASGIVTCAHKQLPAIKLHQQLQQQQIDTTLLDPDYHLNAYLHRDQPALRISVNYYNTENEIERLINILHL